MYKLVARTIVGLAAAMLVITIVVGLVPDDLVHPFPAPLPTTTPIPAPDLELSESDVQLSRPLVEGSPLTVTLTVHNVGTEDVANVVGLVTVARLTADGEQAMVVGRATAGPATAHGALVVPVLVPPVVALVPGPYVYHASVYVSRGVAETNFRNNTAPTGVFALAAPPGDCNGPHGIELTIDDSEPQSDNIFVILHNNGTGTLYNVPVRVKSLQTAQSLEHIYHVPRVLPCGGMASVKVYRQSQEMEVAIEPEGGDVGSARIVIRQ